MAIARRHTRCIASALAIYHKRQRNYNVYLVFVFFFFDFFFGNKDEKEFFFSIQVKWNGRVIMRL